MKNTITVKGANCNYAPGLATYAVDGIQGIQGQHGNNIFYTNFNMNTDIADLRIQIKSNYYPLKGNTEEISRPYQNNDFFFDNDGTIWQLIDYSNFIKSSGTTIVNYFTRVGKITLDQSDYVSLINQTNRIIMDPSNFNGFDIIMGTLDPEDVVNTDVPMNIASNIVDSLDNINLILFNAIKSGSLSKGNMQVYFDTTTKSFHLTSDNPLFIDSDVLINNSSDYVEYDRYNRIMTTSDSITSFKNLCDKLVYDITADTSGNNYVEISVKDSCLSTSEKLNILNELQCKDNIYIKLYDSSVNQYVLEMEPEVKTYNTTATQLNAIDLSVCNYYGVDISVFHIHWIPQSATQWDRGNICEADYIYFSNNEANVYNTSAIMLLEYDGNHKNQTYIMDASYINITAGLFKNTSYHYNNSIPFKRWMPMYVKTTEYDKNNPSTSQKFEFAAASYSDDTYVGLQFNLNMPEFTDDILTMPIKNVSELETGKKYILYYDINYDIDPDQPASVYPQVVTVKVNVLTDTLTRIDSKDPNNPVIATELPSYVSGICKAALLYNTEVFLDEIQ